MGKGLGKIAEQSARARLVLLGEEVEVVAQGDQTLEKRLGFAQATGVNVGIDEPEAAREERTLLAGQAVVGVFRAIAQHEAVAQKVLLYGTNGSLHPRIV